MIPLENRLREQASASGADYFGVANLSPANELVRELSGEMLVRFPRAISIGVKMPTTIVDQLSHHDDKAVALAYRSHGCEIINIRLNQVASRLSSICSGKAIGMCPGGLTTTFAMVSIFLG